jgi:colanic acid/amylovoran biosynthesis glycosyltransferase
VAVSEGIRRMAKKITPNLPIDVIHNGVRRTQNMGARKQPTTPLKFIFAGRVANQKGVIYLVHALAGLPRDNTWQLTLIGDGPRRTEIEAAIQSYHLGEQIKLVGWLDHTEVVRLYQEHDVFVLPSVTEGMPMVLLEAMSYSMPAIATDVSGSQDLIVPGQTGWLVPPQDATALKQAIEDCLNTSPEHLVEMGNAARQRVLEYFTWDTLSNQYLSLFEEVVKGR